MPATTVVAPAASSSATRIAIVAAVGVMILLAALHLLSPEFAPSWRAVSEYANGAWPWVLSLMFVSWAVSTWALAMALRPFATSGVAKAGLALLVIAGVGEAMAAVFDINHPLHGAAAFLGILGFPFAAMLLGINLSRLPSWKPARTRILWLSNLTWISVVLMAASFGMFIAQLKAAGVEVSPDAQPLTALPPGVVPVLGWANRLLIVVYCVWAMVVARQAERATQ